MTEGPWNLSIWRILMNNEIKKCLLEVPASESLDRLQDLMEKDDERFDKLIKNQQKLLDALNQILNAPSSRCSCNDYF
jgi:hypothetical protein